MKISNRKAQRLSALALATVLAACAGGNQALAPLPTAVGNGVSNTAGSSGTHATVYITVPGANAERPRRRGPLYVSPATQSIAITVSSKSAPAKHFNANLTPSSNSQCKATAKGVSCRLVMPLDVGKYSADFATYDGFLNGRDKPTGKELSADRGVPFTVYSDNARNGLQIALQGIPKSIAFVPSPTSILSGSQAGGFTLSRCNAPTQQVSVFGVDADGNFILGPGAPTVTLVSGSSALAVATPKPLAPNIFRLAPPSRPAYASPGSAVYLQAKATPAHASGATAVTAVVTLSFTTDICGVFTEFPIPTASSLPVSIAVGPDKALWFTETAAGKIGRIPTTATLANPSITEYAVPTANGGPWGIAAGSDGSIWFTENNANQIGRLRTDGSPILEFPTPTQPSFPRSMAAGPDGAMWFTEYGAGKIGRIPTSGPISIQEFSVPTASSQPAGIAAGPDGALWFTEAGGNKIGRIPTSGAPITESTIATNNAAPNGIAAGPDGKMWFSEYGWGSNKIGTLPVGGSPITEYTIPAYQAVYLNVSIGITAGPDGSVWFADEVAQTIGRITTDGAVTHFPVPAPDGYPLFIVVGSDGNLWFTDYLANKIGRLQ